jgi:hypothetical protein
MKTKKPKQTLSQRYVILKGYLEKAITSLKSKRKVYPKDAMMYKYYTKQIRLHRQALRLLEDTFSGEDDEIV